MALAAPNQYYDLFIFDDILPSAFSPFRTVEYGHYMNFFNAALFSLEGWHEYVKGETFGSSLEKLPLSNSVKSRIFTLSHADSSSARLAYISFLNNAIFAVDYLERRQIPFILQLYPGGGFEIDRPDSDRNLTRILHSPMLRKLICTQNLTENYARMLVPAASGKIVNIYGGVFDSRVPFDFHKDKKLFSKDKSTIDLCFVAHRYSNDLSVKGYDQFVGIARKMCGANPHMRFHVVGGHTAQDLELGEASDQFRFHGVQQKEFFKSFYPSMDVIVSINRPFTLGTRAFDGFPTGGCIEAGLQGVLNCINDPLGLNVDLLAGEDFILLDLDTDKSARLISGLAADPQRLYELSYRNWRRFHEIFDVDRQLWARTRVVTSELLAEMNGAGPAPSVTSVGEGADAALVGELRRRISYLVGEIEAGKLRA